MIRMGQVAGFFSEVKVELSKVTWPTRQEVIKLTVLVLIISAIVGLYLGVLDFIFTKLVELLISR